MALLGGTHSGKQALVMLITAQKYLKSKESSIEIGGVPCGRNPAYLSQCFLIPETPSLPAIKIHHYAEYIGALYPHFDMYSFLHYGQILKLDFEKILKKQSIGAQKKFLLALALATKAPLIVGSNLFYHISPPDGELIRAAVQEYYEEDSTLLFVGSDLPYIEKEISRCTMLHKGSILYSEDTAELDRAYNTYIDEETNLIAIKKHQAGDGPWERSLFFTNYTYIEPKFLSLIQQEQEEVS